MAHKELTWAQLAGWMQGLAPGPDMPRDFRPDAPDRG
jgi:hypothetical protein